MIRRGQMPVAAPNTCGQAALILAQRAGSRLIRLWDFVVQGRP